MAAGGGPRDWSPDDAYGYSASGATPARPHRRTASPVLVIGIAAVVIVVIFVIGTLVAPRTPSLPVAAQQPAVVQPAAPEPPRVVYQTAAAERHDLLVSAQQIASTLYAMSRTGQPLPTSFDNTMEGTLVAEPSGRILGSLANGNTVEWASDADGRVTTLTLIGATFGTRVPLDVSALQPVSGSNT